MRATIHYIENRFREFNELMFEGKLPKLPIELSDSKTFLGLCVCQKRRSITGKTELYNFRLRFNTRIDLSEEELEDTIIHEMIHYYIGYNKMKDSSAHGTIFKQIMNEINQNYGRHISISHKGTKEQKEQAYGNKKRWHAVAVVSFTNGKTGVKVLPRIAPRIINYYNVVGSNSNVSDIKLYMCNDPFFNRYPNSSAFTVIYVSHEEIMSHLAEAEQMMCDGKALTLSKTNRK